MKQLSLRYAACSCLNLQSSHFFATVYAFQTVLIRISWKISLNSIIYCGHLYVLAQSIHLFALWGHKGSQNYLPPAMHIAKIWSWG